MFKVSHKTLIVISGLVWMAVGAFLLPLGLKLMVSAALNQETEYPLLSALAPFTGGTEGAALFLVAICLMIGYAKGKYVLGKSVRRSINRILSFPNPTSLANIYSRGYYLLFASMVLLGMSIKWFGLSQDIRAFVDVAIGAALINGAMVYFRCAMDTRRHPANG